MLPSTLGFILCCVRLSNDRLEKEKAELAHHVEVYRHQTEGGDGFAVGKTFKILFVHCGLEQNFTKLFFNYGYF